MFRSSALILAAATALTAAPALAATSVVGTTAATFVDPKPTTTTYTGMGTNQITWGDDASLPGWTVNRMTFAANTPFSSTVGQNFKIGSISYYNGTVALGSTPTSIGLNLAFDFLTPGMTAFSSLATLGLASTQNYGVNADADADYIFLPALTSSTNFSANGQNYVFSLLGFSNVVGDGFLNSSASQFHVREGSNASADVFGIVNVAAVPEPATWAMMLIGFGMVGAASRYRRRAVKSAIA